MFIYSFIYRYSFNYIYLFYLYIFLGKIMRYESSYAGCPPPQKKNTKAEICNFVFYWVETSFPSKNKTKIIKFG